MSPITRRCALLLLSGLTFIAGADPLQLGDKVAERRFQADDWHFAVLAYDGEKLNAYVDGEPVPALWETHT